MATVTESNAETCGLNSNILLLTFGKYVLCEKQKLSQKKDIVNTSRLFLS